jgi:hypothetical protein
LLGHQLDLERQDESGGDDLFLQVSGQRGRGLARWSI